MNIRIVLFLCVFVTLGLFVGQGLAQEADRSDPQGAGEDITAEKEGSSTIPLDEMPPYRETADKLTIKVDIGRVRAEPSLDAGIKFRLKKGARVSPVETREDWYLIEVSDGRSGWAHKNLFSDFRKTAKTVPAPKSAMDEPAVPAKTDPTSDTQTPGIVIPSMDSDLISLNFREIDIRALISALAMKQEINIVMAKDVSGKISVHLYQVTLDEALDAITLAGGFGYHYYGDLYYVYKPQKSRDPEQDLIEMRVFKLNFVEVEKVQEILDDIPGMRKIKIHEPSKTLIARDTPENIQKIETLLTYWDTVPRQVMIEAKILDVKLTDDMTLGVDWNQLLGEAALGTGGFSRAVLPTAPGTNPVPATGAGVFGNLITGVGTAYQFTAAIDALQEKTEVNTLSTPKILAIHGKKARVQVGGKQGYRVSSTSLGVLTESIEFIDTGTILEITPYINEEGSVLLNVKPSISTASITTGGIPVVSETTVTTWMLAQSGQTVFIGGLIQELKTRKKEMIPCLGDIPGIGAIFGRTASGFGKFEMVVLITPQIIETDIAEQSRESRERVEKTEEMYKRDSAHPIKRHFEIFDPK
ncbi:SH3 domain-containing protein [Thermodesulfobacteriota bacterium]